MTEDKKPEDHVIYVAFPSGNAGYIVGFDPDSAVFGVSSGVVVITLDKQVFAFDPIVVILTSIPSPEDPDKRYICYNPRIQKELTDDAIEWLSNNPEWGLEAGLKQILGVLYETHRHKDKIIDIRNSVFNLTNMFELQTTRKQTVH